MSDRENRQDDAADGSRTRPDLSPPAPVSDDPTGKDQPLTQAWHAAAAEYQPDGTSPKNASLHSAEEDCPNIPGFEVIGELGRGGMGVVYKARETELDRVVALKMVSAAGRPNSEQLMRFRAEAQAAARLQHPNIVQVHAVGDWNGLPYFSQEYVGGGSLARKTARQPQPAREAAQTVETLARAIHFAHQHGIVHRDLKPANVLLTEAGIPKVADFGLARRLEEDSAQTRTGAVVGTPSYMAPEQAEGRGKEAGPPADVYALGVILYELLVGRPPFIGATILDTLEQVRSLEPVPPAQLQPKVPRDLETVCLKCLRKDPAQRYPGGDALADDLHRFLNGEPIRARPVGSAERFIRWCRRNPRLAGLSAAVLGLLLIVAGVSTTFAFLLADRQKKTEEAREEAEDRYAITLKALDVMIVQMQTGLENIPGTVEVRQEVLEAALELLRKSPDGKDSSGLAMRGKATAHFALGNLFWAEVKRQEAVEHYEKADTLMKAVLAAHPDIDKSHFGYAAILAKQGDLARALRGDSQTARKLHLESLRIKEELLANPPPRQELSADAVRESIASSHHRLGEMAFDGFNPNLAKTEEHLGMALALREKLSGPDPGSSNRQNIGHLYYLLGLVRLKQGKNEEARQFFSRSLTIRKALVQANPHNQKHQGDLILLGGAVGDTYLFARNHAEARRYFQETIAPSERQVALDERRESRELLAQNYYRLALTCQLTDDQTNADLYYGKCLQLRTQLQKETPKCPFAKITLMIPQARCGLLSEATALAREVSEQYPKKAEYLVQVACCYAACADWIVRGKSLAQLTSAESLERERYVTLGIELLRQAKAAGYDHLRTIEVEPDLDALRQDKRFQDHLESFPRPPRIKKP